MNIAKLLTRSAASSPARPAIIHGQRQIDYGTFDARANRLAAGLRRLGIRAGDNVSVLMYNRPEMLEAMFACFKLGCAAVPLNFRLHPNEVAYIVDNSESRALIMSPEFVEPMTAIRERFPGTQHLIAVEACGQAATGLLDYEQLLGAERDTFDDADVAPDDVACLEALAAQYAHADDPNQAARWTHTLPRRRCRPGCRRSGRRSHRCSAYGDSPGPRHMRRRCTGFRPGTPRPRPRTRPPDRRPRWCTRPRHRRPHP